VSGEVRRERNFGLAVDKSPTCGTERTINRIAEVFRDGIPPDEHKTFIDALMDQNLAQQRFRGLLWRSSADKEFWGNACEAFRSH
jgi:hypothetical protein